jgi:D-alanyl-D-alanine carboxypeptidase/D-alanyl-D-alanine-endopeptidase (penicillin-binding protein 4)
MKTVRKYVAVAIVFILMIGCASRKKAAFQLGENEIIELENAIGGGHLGISIYDNERQQYMVDHHASKYFTPASNVKLFTCYAAMKYLADSLVSFRYFKTNDGRIVGIIPGADPTFLNPEFEDQPAFRFLQKNKNNSIALCTDNWRTTALGKGWSWDDYSEEYMTERSALPMYANQVWFKLKNQTQLTSNASNQFLIGDSNVLEVIPKYFENNVELGDISFYKEHDKYRPDNNFSVSRGLNRNEFLLNRSTRPFKSAHLPFLTEGLTSRLLFDTVKKSVYSFRLISDFKETLKDSFWVAVEDHQMKVPKLSTLYSYPTDSLLKKMMHRSDNFYAEQILLMASKELLGNMNEENLIDSIMKTDFLTMPDKPVWVDGSGLSRYNLVTPRSFVWLLNKMKNEFGLNRLQSLLPTGGTGTLLHYYQNETGKIYAKTGTLGGQVAISGFLITDRNKLLTFSILVSNHNTSTVTVRRAVENYLLSVKKRN